MNRAVRDQLDRACQIVTAQRKGIDKLVEALLERDTLVGPEIRACFADLFPREATAATPTVADRSAMLG